MVMGLPIADVIALDARPAVVAQADRFGAQRECALRRRVDEGEAAAAAAQEIGGAVGVGEPRRGAGEENQARLLETGRGGERMRRSRNRAERRASATLGNAGASDGTTAA